MTFDQKWLSFLLFSFAIIFVAMGLSGCEYSSQDISKTSGGLSHSLANKVEQLVAAKGKKPSDQGAAIRVWKKGEITYAAQADNRGQISALIESAIENLKKEGSGEGVVILCLPRNMNVDLENLRGQERSRKGLLGARLGQRSESRWLCPHEVTAQNLELDMIVDQFTLKNMNPTEPLDFIGEKWAFDEFVITNKDGRIWEVNPLLRGKRVVSAESVSKASTQKTAQLLADWMFRSVQADGRMLYKWQPSESQEAKGNNMIRQFMATVSLVRWGNAHPENEELQKKIKLNLEYNIKSFYREMDGLGVIEFRNKRKLGAIALAALAIHESKFRQDFDKQYRGLIRATQKMWQTNGSFRTHYRSKKNDNQNFYPGETLLLWSYLLAEKGDEKLLTQFNKSVDYYYGHYHQIKPNPAFVPWHTQAYYRVWKISQDVKLKTAIFRMNDWLVETMQEWDGHGVLADEKGRFSSEAKPFGPPHASSTGVYLEGLIDAYRLAVDVKDGLRAKRYRTAMVRGIRSLQQLQFKDSIDAYYVKNPDAVLGSVQTSVSDNTIRVDNVQHNLMGLIQILETLTEEDFRVPQETFRGRIISNRNFSGKNLSDYDFHGTNGKHLDFTGTNLRGADLGRSICWHCDFSGADLRGADLSQAEFLPPRFEGARIDDRTKLPFHVSRSLNLGMVKGDQQ